MLYIVRIQLRLFPAPLAVLETILDQIKDRLAEILPTCLLQRDSGNYGRSITKSGEVQVSQSAGMLELPLALSTEMTA